MASSSPHQPKVDPLGSNKIAGAVLAAATLAVGLNVFSQILYTPKKPAVPGYELPVPEPAASAAPNDQSAQAVPLPVLLASADPAKGQAAAKKCTACHVFEKGGANKIGPALHDVIGRAKGSVAGFAYSTALKNKGGDWTYEDMDGFLANPKGWLPGTIMAFQGISNPKERADISAYLRSQSDDPKPFPAAPEAAAQPAAATAPAPVLGPNQTSQQAAPPTPGQRVDPGPAPIAVDGQSANPQSQPSASQQPTPTVPPSPEQTNPVPKQ